MRVEPEPKKGSTFFGLLSNDSRESSMNDVQQTPYEVLLVEDSEDDIILTEEAFKECGYALRVHEVADGEAALHFLRHEGEHHEAPRPHLIILDLNLPRKSGLSVLKEIKADKQLQDIPVVVLSTSNMDRDVQASYQHYANCYIIKPSDVSVFFDIIKQMMRFWFSVAALPQEK